ncbi:MAG: HprK-related kinase A [Azonexus sp.]|mgnify:CR=1 FL=1
MKLASLSAAELAIRLGGEGVALSIGDFAICLKSPLSSVAKAVAFFYGDYELCAVGSFIDYRVEVAPPSVIRRWFRPQVNFSFDGLMPFKPLPQVQAFAMFEWGLNWVIANNAHQFLVIHAAVVERHGRALIFPGSPGSGKSTLCAALVNCGWRLLSDEMALISLANGLVTPFPRPVSLKNASIDIIGRYAEKAVIGDVIQETAKGSVAHMRPPVSSVAAGGRQSIPSAVIFPRWQAGVASSLSELPKGQTLLKVAENSFNYNVLGITGFNALADTINRCRCYAYTYEFLDDAVETMELVVQDG